MNFRINRVYTRSGDDGQTGLVGGDRVAKTDLRVCAYGDIDELNSQLGVAKEFVDNRTDVLREVIEYLQQELFDLGSELATASAYEGMWRANAEHAEYLEYLCDHFGTGQPELKSFILPGGSLLASSLHVCRTVARRAERSAVRLRESFLGGDARHNVSAEVIVYLNRLSDLLFILCRWSLATQNREVPLWTKNTERKRPQL